MKKITIILLVGALLWSPSVFALSKKDKEARAKAELETEKALFMASGVEDRVLKIGLVDAVLYALKNNSDVLLQRIEPKLKRDDVKIAEADFEPEIKADYTLHDNTERSTNSLSGVQISNYRDINLNASVSGKLITGTEYTFEVLNQRYKSNSVLQTMNPYYVVEPKVTVTQPLFRGFGILVNKADILVARNDLLQSDNSFKNTVMSSVSEAKISYYNYAYNLEAYSIAKLSLDRAKSLLEINNARYQKGLVSNVELLETEAALADREKAFLSAESSVKKAEDDLKAVTNIVKDPEVWNARIELIDEPGLKEEEVDLAESFKNAFRHRPDYASAKIDLENRDIKIKVAKNDLLPTVDLVSSFGLNGLDKYPWGALRKADSDHSDWSVGAEFTLPFGGAERAEYDKKKLEKAQALLSFKKLERDIILDVRDKVRAALLQKRQVHASRLSKEKESQNYDAQQERYAAGEVSTHDMLDYQDKLSRSELDYVKSLVDYNVSLIELDKAQGLTLEKNDIKLE